MEHEGLIREILNKYKLDYENYYDVALIGLAKAYKIFDKNKGCKFNTLAYNCIRNQLLQQVQIESYGKRKQEKYNVSIYKELSEDFQIIDTLKADDDVEQQVIDNEIKKILNKYIDKLEFEEKTCILLRHYSSCKPNEIAEFLGLDGREEHYLYKKTLKKLNRMMKGEMKQWLDY